MRIFLFTLCVSSFIGVSLFAAIRYTQTYIKPLDPIEKSIKVGHLDNLFAAEKVSDANPETDESQEWEVAEENLSEDVSTAEALPTSSRGATERRAPAEKKKASKPAKPKGTPRGKTDLKTFDFGSIDEGDVITHFFTISNKGTAPLTIRDFEVGCGCTMVDYPKKPIQPGKSVKFKAVFDSKDKLGPQNKLVRLITNGVPRNLDMYFKGYVYPKNFGKNQEEESPSPKENEEKAPADTTKKQVVKG